MDTENFVSAPVSLVTHRARRWPAPRREQLRERCGGVANLGDLAAPPAHSLLFDVP